MVQPHFKKLQLTTESVFVMNVGQEKKIKSQSPHCPAARVRESIIQYQLNVNFIPFLEIIYRQYCETPMIINLFILMQHDGQGYVNVVHLVIQYLHCFFPGILPVHICMICKGGIDGLANAGPRFASDELDPTHFIEQVWQRRC